MRWDLLASPTLGRQRQESPESGRQAQNPNEILSQKTRIVPEEWHPKVFTHLLGCRMGTVCLGGLLADHSRVEEEEERSHHRAQMRTGEHREF